MIESYGISNQITEPIVVRLSLYDDSSLDRYPLCYCKTNLANNKMPKDYSAFITDLNEDQWNASGGSVQKPGLFSLENIRQFQHGDGIALLPEGKALLVYRPGSNSNALFVTSRCNSNCIMCPQPPQNEGYDLSTLAFNILKVIDPETDIIGITGGEPTLLAGKLFILVEMIKKRFPLASLHILSNGRFFSKTENAIKLSGVKHPDILLGIPLFSDNPCDHDNITRTKGSFAQTIKGVINLSNSGIGVEIRVVMVKQVVSRLEKLAEFIYRNFPFTSQVCFMGMEPIGFALDNYNEVWIDPVDYQKTLRNAVSYLSLRGIPVNIYNEQLCVLSQDLWKYDRRSISDWKNNFIDECSECTLISKCGGFFESSVGFHSKGIHKYSDVK